MYEHKNKKSLTFLQGFRFLSGNYWIRTSEPPDFVSRDALNQLS